MTNLIDSRTLRDRLASVDLPGRDDVAGRLDDVTTRIPSRSDVAGKFDDVATRLSSVSIPDRGDLPSRPDLSDLADLPGVDRLSDIDLGATMDDLGDAAASVADGLAVAGRRSRGLARRAVRTGVQVGTAGARSTVAAAKTAGRATQRTGQATVDVAKRHPRAAAGVAVGVVALLVALVWIRRSRSKDDETNAHLAAVA